MKPVIKWAGGKSRMLKHIIPLLPKDIKNYYEPFFGGGALYTKIEFQKGFINDFNPEIMNLYEVIKTKPQSLIKLLKTHKKNDCFEYFQKIREMDRKNNFNNLDLVEKAARTVYLNKTCFGGLYRVNSKGYFNVPYAKNINGKEILNEKNIMLWNEKLLNTKTKMTVGDFEDIIKLSGKGDFLFLDPPYFKWSNTANFTSYTKEGFDHDDQTRLRNCIIEADKRGVKFLLTNSGTKEVMDFYKMFKVKRVPIVRTIAASKNKRGYFEVIVTNY